MSDTARPYSSAPPPDHPAVIAFRRLVQAVEARDFPTATRCRKALYRMGWSVIPKATWPTGGRRP